MMFEVRAVPGPQGSKDQFGRESSKKVGPWREAVRTEAATAMRHTGRGPLAGPVAVTVIFYLPRPRGHYGTGRNVGRLKDSAPAVPATRPDLDKLTRSTLDALTAAGVYGDDAQVTDLDVRKRYADGVPVGALVGVDRATL